MALRRSARRGKELHDAVIRLAVAGSIQIGTGSEVLGHGQLGEYAPAFHHLRNPLSDDVRGLFVGDVLALEGDGAFGDVGFVHVVQAGDGSHRGGLAGAIGAEQGHDLTIGHLDRDPTQNEDHVVVHDFEVLDGQHFEYLGGVGGPEPTHTLVFLLNPPARSTLR